MLCRFGIKRGHISLFLSGFIHLIPLPIPTCKNLGFYENLRVLVTLWSLNVPLMRPILSLNPMIISLFCVLSKAIYMSVEGSWLDWIANLLHGDFCWKVWKSIIWKFWTQSYRYILSEAENVPPILTASWKTWTYNQIKYSSSLRIKLLSTNLYQSLPPSVQGRQMMMRKVLMSKVTSDMPMSCTLWLVFWQTSLLYIYVDADCWYKN